MVLNRRGFFSVLSAVAATAVLDPEKLLWVPKRKLISIPKPRTAMQIIDCAFAGLPAELTRREDREEAFRRLQQMLDRWNQDPLWI